jgi:putative colanic acid biosysnthesis UDP-glucose lipid carrier transferase
MMCGTQDGAFLCQRFQGPRRSKAMIGRAHEETRAFTQPGRTPARGGFVLHVACDVAGMSSRRGGREKLSPGTALRVKRATDACIAGILLCVSLPLFILIALAVLLETGRPVLYRQSRRGHYGRVFQIVKFRTMTANAKDGYQASPGDPRVTSVGRFLRKSSLDEIPQLWNVLRGDMSIVGPRPHPLWLDARYGPLLLDYQRRLLMPPGITGLAQISGCRGFTPTNNDMRRRLDLDLQYVENWHLGMDLQILLRTPAVLWSGDAC